MSSIKERLDELRRVIQTPEFLRGQGLGNEIGIYTFCYDPKDEIIVQHFTRQITSDSSLKCHLFECNLYSILFEICDDKNITQKISELEEKKGSEFILKQLVTIARPANFAQKIQNKLTDIENRVVLITGVGDAFPFIRVHNLLSAMQSLITDPILVLYPGEFSNGQLQLFSELPPNDYYRAFNLIADNR